MKTELKMKTIRTGIALALMAGISGADVYANTPEASADSLVSIVSTLNASGHITVSQPDALNARLARVAGEPGDTLEVATGETSAAVTNSKAGYRVQVFDDNNPRTARSSAASFKNKIESAFPAYRAYVSFNSPYWRVKVGDFRSRAEAESVMAEIRRAFPELKAYIRIVRDRVNVYD